MNKLILVIVSLFGISANASMLANCTLLENQSQLNRAEADFVLESKYNLGGINIYANSSFLFLTSDIPKELVVRETIVDSKVRYTYQKAPANIFFDLVQDTNDLTLFETYTSSLKRIMILSKSGQSPILIHKFDQITPYGGVTTFGIYDCILN